jgi:tape measure domain-containing protein
MTERRISIVVDGDGRLAVVAIEKTTGAMTRLEGATAALRTETESATQTAQRNATATRTQGQAQEQASRQSDQLERATAELRAEMQQLLQSSQRTSEFMRRDLSAALGTLIDRADRTATGIERMGTQSQRTRRDVGLLAQGFEELKGILAAYVGLQGVQALGSMVDGYADIIGRLDDVTSGEAALSRAREDTLRISREYYANLDATATLYARTTTALGEMRMGQSAVAEIVATVNAGLLVGRASTQESASAIQQLSQAFGAGRLSGEEFNAVFEASPQLMRLFADQLGAPIGAMKELAAEGRITDEVMAKALTSAAAEELRRRAELVPLTIARAWQLARTNATEYFGDADQSLGASSAIAQSIRLLSENLDLLVVTGVAIAGLYGGRMTAAALRSAAGWTTHTAALVRDTAAQNAQQVALLRGQGVATASAVRTVALANAQTVATATTVRFNAALAFVGGPIGVAIAGLGALSVAFAAAGDDGERSAADVANAWRAAKRSLDDFNAAPTAAGVDALTDSQVVRQIDEARTRLQELRAEAVEVRDTYSRQIARFGFVDEGLTARMNAASAAVEEQRQSVQALEGAYGGAVQRTADMLEQLAGVTESTPQARQQLEALADRVLKSNKDMETWRDQLSRTIGTIYGAEAATRVLNASFRELSGAMAGGDYVRNMEQSLRREQVRMLRITDGNRAASRRELGLAIVDEQRKQGRDLNRDELARMYRAWREVADATDAADSAQQRLRETTRAGAREARQDATERKRDINEAVRAMERLRDQVRDQRGGLGTAVDRADADNSRALQSLAQLERESAATTELAERKRLLAEAYALQATAHESALRVARNEDAERERQRDIVGRTLDDLREEAAAAGLSARERELLRLVMQAEAKAREQMNAGMRTSATLSIEETAQIRSQANAYLDARQAADGLRELREGQQQEIDQLRAAVKSRGELTAAARAELAIRKSLLGVSEEQARLREEEIAQIRAQARELDTLNGQQGIQSTLRDLFGRVIDGQQQGRGVWESFRNEGVRAFAEIAREFAKIRKSSDGWRDALKKTGVAVKEMLPEIGQLAGTIAGGGGSGAQIGSLLGSAIGGYFFGYIGAAIGGLIGGLAGGTFDDNPEIRVGPTVRNPEQWRNSRLQNFQVRTESMTDPTSRKVADTIVEFDNLIWDMLDAPQRAAARAALSGFSSNAPILEDILKDRFAAVLRTFNKTIGDFVWNSSTDLQTQMQNLNDILELQRLEGRGELLTGTLERAVRLIEAFGRAGETAGQTYQRLGGIANNYAEVMTGVNRQIAFNGLNEFQRQQVEIELQYRSQVKQVNDLARAFGLSGARAEDLARIEELRAINMASVQRQMEEERNRVLADLALSDLSPLRDDQKLDESMRQLRQAVAGGDFNRAQELSQQTLGFGRNLFASGRDYNALYAEVTGLLRQVGFASTASLTETQLDNIADLLFDMPMNIAKAMFDQLILLIPKVASSAGLPADLTKPLRTSTSSVPPESDPVVVRELQTQNALLKQILENTKARVQIDREALAQARGQELRGIGAER